MEWVKKLFPYVIMLGIISYVLVSSFGMDNNLLTPTTINGITFYTFDLRSYIDRLQYIWTTYIPAWDSFEMITDIRLPNNIWNITEFFSAYFHDWIVIISWFMLPITILTWIGNFILFAFQMLLAVIGFPADSMIVNIVEFCKELANIPNEIMIALSQLG